MNFGSERIEKKVSDFSYYYLLREIRFLSIVCFHIGTLKKLQVFFPFKIIFINMYDI